jgi:hypothetical protein
MSAPEYPSQQNNSASPDSGRTQREGEALAETALADVGAVGREVGEQAAAIGEEVKAQAGQLAQKAKGMASEQKDLLATQLVGVSEAINKVAGELEGQDQPAAQYVRMVADSARRLTSSLKDNDVDDILAMAQKFGREQPVAFLGAAALLGFAASRFVMSSAHRDQQNANRADGATRSDSGYAPSGSAPDYAQSVGGEDAGI